jgi:hypothetical protein
MGEAARKAPVRASPYPELRPTCAVGYFGAGTLVSFTRKLLNE